MRLMGRPIEEPENVLVGVGDEEEEKEEESCREHRTSKLVINFLPDSSSCLFPLL